MLAIIINVFYSNILIVKLAFYSIFYPELKLLYEQNINVLFAFILCDYDMSTIQQSQIGGVMLKKTLIATTISLLSANVVASVIDYPYPFSGNDPLMSEQWHLLNSAQSSFSTGSGIAGNDLDVDFANAMGIKGRGITVSVIDTGVQIDHPDLAANVVPGSLNVVDGSDFPTDNHGHGTAVAGLIASVSDNGIGGRGVAPYANLIGFNYLDGQSTAAWLVSHGLSEDFRELNRFTDPRVFNQSYGSTPPLPSTYDYATDPYLELTDLVQADISENSHVGRGAIYVKSAGNSFENYYAYYNGYRILVLAYEDNQYFNNNNLPFHNANLSTNNVNFWNLVVSATNADGVLSSYSSVGANVFISAPGGEFGDDSPAMVTTDLTGCDRGTNVAGPHYNALHGGSALDLNCDYTATMNGTSSAAPNTSGAIATVMSTNHALDARTIRHILAETARQNHADHPGVDLTFENAAGEQVTYNAIPAWQTNAAGYKFHNHYGFGAVDVDAAVYKAMFTSSSLPELQITDWVKSGANAEIPDASLVGAEDSLQVNSDLTVEAVQVKLNIDHSRLRDLAIELISPSGTRSVLMSARTGLLAGRDGGYTDSVMLSNHFYGESAKGNWTLKVIDTDKGSSYTLGYHPSLGLIGFNSLNNDVAGLLKDWSIKVYGH